MSTSVLMQKYLSTMESNLWYHLNNTSLWIESIFDYVSRNFAINQASEALGGNALMVRSLVPLPAPFDWFVRWIDGKMIPNRSHFRCVFANFCLRWWKHFKVIHLYVLILGTDLYANISAYSIIYSFLVTHFVSSLAHNGLNTRLIIL